MPEVEQQPLQPERAKRPRLLHVDVAKGLGMLLVVYGHLIQANSVGETAFYAFTRDKIYTFHMPFFLYLSGYVFFMTGAHQKLGAAWRKILTSRADRLLVPFLFFGLVIIVGKDLAGRFGEVHEGVSSIPDGLWRMVSNAPENPNMSIWYLLVLFVYSLVTGPLLAIFRGRIGLLFVVAVVVALFSDFLGVTERFYLARVLRYYPFFLAGGWIWLHWEQCGALMRRYWLPVTAAFLLVVVFSPWPPVTLLVCGLLSIPALHGAMLFPAAQRSRLLQVVGANSMAIYLMNTIFIGVAKLLWLRILPSAGVWNLAFLASLMAAGVLGPMVARQVIRRMPLIRRAEKYIA